MFTFIFLTFLPALSFAVLPTPVLDAVQNYSGPLIVFWNVNGSPPANTQYWVCVSTLSMLTGTTDQLMADPQVNAQMGGTYTAGSAMRYTLTKFFGEDLVDGQAYRIKVFALSATDSSAASNFAAGTSKTERLKVMTIQTSGDGPNGDQLLTDTSTMPINCTLLGESGAYFIGPAKVKLDIKTQGTTIKSVFNNDNPLTTLSVNVVISSSNFSAVSSTFTWDGTIEVDRNHKHVGNYTIIATPLDENDTAVASGNATKTIKVDLPHINSGQGIVYTTQGNDVKHYGPPFYLDYYLSLDSFITMWIEDLNGNVVKTVASSVPRPGGDTGTSWDAIGQRELWDGRNDQGFIVGNSIYYCFLAATDANGRAASTAWGTIAYDVLRLIDTSATGITDKNPLAHIKYTLAGANSQMGGATIKIAICSPGTTFYMASTAGTLSYLNGTSTYTYVAGDPLPVDATHLKKVFVFARTAGQLDETWNGYDETGAGLPNDNYIFAISATDDSGNHAIDNSGNDRIIIGNITIDRTSAQTAGDSAPPSVSSITVSGTSVSLTNPTTLTQTFNSLSVILADSGGSGVDFTGTMMTLTGPAASNIALSLSDDGINTLTATFANQTSSGTYTLRIRPKDKVGNTASDVVCTFVLSAAASAQVTELSASVYAYPNPAKGAASITFAYYMDTIATMKLEIYNILGELMYTEKWTSQATGAQTKSWNIVNQAQNKLASGVYLYRIVDESDRNKSKKLKKLIIVQ